MAEKNPDELGALWTRTGGRGEYMTGTINGVKVVCFANDKRGNEKAPDWRVLKSKPREARAETATPPDLDDSSIPF